MFGDIEVAKLKRMPLIMDAPLEISTAPLRGVVPKLPNLRRYFTSFFFRDFLNSFYPADRLLRFFRSLFAIF
jgi:hypothetical protein